MSNVFGNIRFVVLLLGFLLSVGIAFFVESTIPSETLQTIRLTQFYALTAVCFLYLTLLAGPLTYTFRSLPFRGPYLKSRRALGVLTFYYSLLHVYFAFFKQLGGFEGIGFLTGKFLLAISLSAIALFILMLLATTSFDALVKRLTFPKWKLLHRFVYIAGILILVHAMMLGTHFEELADLIPQAVFLGLVFLLILESLRVDALLRKKFQTLPNLGVTTIGIIALAASGFVLLFLPTGRGISLGIHAEHIQIAKDAQKNSTNTQNITIPGMKGDRTKRYSVSFTPSSKPQPNQNVDLSISIFDAASGNPTVFFTKMYEKFMHLIVVDSSLTYFEHIHPEQIGNTFSITHQFPKNDTYHLYADFQPFGAIEQQMAFTLDVGDTIPQQSQQSFSFDTTKSFDDYEITMQHPKPLIASKMSVGEQKISFTIKDKNGNPVRTLKPYLGAYGHLVMINTKTHEYVHVHPTDLTTPKPDQNGRPDVEFLPLGLYGPIKPGVYRVFGEFNPNGQYLKTDFTVTIQ